MNLWLESMAGSLELLNELDLVGNVSDDKESNSKLMRALSEEGDLKTTIIKDNSNLDDMSLDEVYGRLKTHDLELSQGRSRKIDKGKSYFKHWRCSYEDET